MPRYKVTAVGFIGGVMYDPNGKRSTVNTDKPLKPVPSWLKPMTEETAAQKKTRVKTEKADAKESAEKATEDKEAIADVTFTSSAIETL